MIDRFVQRMILGMPLGFLVALVCCAVGLAAGWKVALSLDDMRSFADIARPSVIAIGCAAIGALVAIATTHRIDRE